MYNAVILAGGKTPWLQKAVGTNIRALAPLGGRRMVEYIIDALDQSGMIDRIIVAADSSQWEAAVLPQRAELVPWLLNHARNGSSCCRCFTPNRTDIICL